jgi:hypothetical protein
VLLRTKLKVKKSFPMLKIKLILYTALITLVGCSPILEPKTKIDIEICSENITGLFNRANLHQEYIFLESENGNFVTYDLTQNKTSCDVEISDDALFSFEAEAAKKMAAALRQTAESNSKMMIKTFSSENANFQKLVENKCAQMKLNFMFGLETEEGPVIGCQTSANSKSAIMFKQNKKNSSKIEVAFLSFYEPLIEKFIN